MPPTSFQDTDLAERAITRPEVATETEALTFSPVLRERLSRAYSVPLRPGLRARAEDSLMRVLDITFSLIAIAFMVPVLAAIAAVVYVYEGKSPIFSQARLGESYKPFRCLKFLTMRSNSDHLLKAYLAAHPLEARNWRDFHKLKHDPRVTFVGHFLRKSSLDELPQLINVLKGEMSLVGPRPIMLTEADKYGRSLSIYTRVRPGITGLWQVRGRNRLTYRQRIACDRLYVRKRSLGLYLLILWQTVPAVLFQRGSS